ncbi:MAG: thymidine phosphorylase [Nanoarchaeota archaeon]|mgnify:CR=1 FL=1
MILKIRHLNWSAGRPVAILNKKTAEKLGANVNERISLKDSHGEILAVLDTASGFIKENEVAVSKEVNELINLKKSENIEVSLAPILKSLDLIKKKMNGKTLNKSEIKLVVKDIVNNSLSEADVSFFVSAVYKNGMSLEETAHLIEAFLATGKILKIPGKIIADKHSIGGIAGNRTTPLIVSICAAAGLIIPKTSSRAITSAAGTADVIETIANVGFSIKQLKTIIKKTNAFMVWGGSFDLVPADSEILRIEKNLRLDVSSFLLASIISKKLSVGSTHIIIDIPYGKSAKVNLKQALDLKNRFEYLGKRFKLKLKCIITNGEQPIGNGIGPVLELIDILNILQGKGHPKDLEEKSIFLSGQLLELAGKAKKNEGKRLAEEILYSGKAFKKFKEIIEAQGGKISHLSPGKFFFDIKTKKSGRIFEIDNKKINELARIAGCPSDKRSGLYLHFHVGEVIKKNKKILTIYSESNYRLKKAIKFYKNSPSITIK